MAVGSGFCHFVQERDRLMLSSQNPVSSLQLSSNMVKQVTEDVRAGKHHQGPERSPRDEEEDSTW